MLPVCVWPNLHHSRPFSIQYLLRIGQVKEVKLHVDRRWWILPGLK